MNRAVCTVLRLRGDTTGAAVVEFAMVAPVLLLTLVGLFDLGHTIYTEAQLQGAIQKAARDSSIQGANDVEIDAKVTTAVRDIVQGATIAFARKSYTNFSDVSQPEDYTDSDNSGLCDNGEPFEDANGNGVWDQDRGKIGSGGARDAVLYTVDVAYPRAFPLHRFVPLPDSHKSRAQTVLRNQPFNAQGVSDAVGNCL
ncbi:TadE family protein [Altererythrobacter aquiaggeris]|uniref:TadE/TadG family type IV pilus assembly protein n=1 Tax=Aestuarierythrobacter aquiaggeris TaxID=1898396 RepID=UPI0030176CBF